MSTIISADDEIDAAVGALLDTSELQSVALPDDWWEPLTYRSDWYESPSSINSFVACPLRWYLERYSNLPGGEASFPSVVGSLVHRILEVFYSEPQHLRTENLLRRTFRAAWDSLSQHGVTGLVPSELQAEFDQVINSANNPDGERGRFYNRCRTSIDNVLEFDGDPSEVKVISTEKWIRIPVGNRTVRGKIDRVVDTGRGGVICQDWKTGRPPEDDVEIDVLSPPYIPLGIYVLALSQGNDPSGRDGENVIGAQLLYLTHARRFNIRVRPQTLDRTRILIQRVVAEMNLCVATNNFPVRPGPTSDSGACSWCPVQALCPAWQDGTFNPLRERLEI